MEKLLLSLSFLIFIHSFFFFILSLSFSLNYSQQNLSEWKNYFLSLSFFDLYSWYLSFFFFILSLSLSLSLFFLSQLQSTKFNLHCDSPNAGKLQVQEKAKKGQVAPCHLKHAKCFETLWPCRRSKNCPCTSPRHHCSRNPLDQWL